MVGSRQRNSWFLLACIIVLLAGCQTLSNTEHAQQPIQQQNSQEHKQSKQQSTVEEIEQSEIINLVDSTNNQPLADIPYEIIDCNGKKVAEGRTDKNGKTVRASSAANCATLPNKGLKFIYTGDKDINHGW